MAQEKGNIEKLFVPGECQRQCYGGEDLELEG